MPCVALVTYLIMLAANIPHPAPQFPLPASFVLLAAFLLAALGEEMGWSGYAIDPLQERWTAFKASLLLGVVWAAWHIIAMIQTGQSAPWIAWGCLDMVATRVIMVWIYDNTNRSVLAVVFFHAIANLTFKSVFPGGSYASERIIAVILAIIAVIVTLVWGPRTLTRARQSSSPPMPDAHTSLP
jgi:membrane protease YdiL (CAAX protease family)